MDRSRTRRIVLALGCAIVAACATDTGASSEEGSEGLTATCGELGQAPAVGGEAFHYGRHYPNGDAAVAYAYGSDGMWKVMSPLEYKWNYYPQDGTADHPYDVDALIGYANGTHFTTALDANAHLLGDLDHDGEVDRATWGAAFHEHNGRGVGGAPAGTPFTNFWFDDNMLARFMSDAYARPEPDGLSDYPDFNRWRILGGDSRGWTPYETDFFDTRSLDGLYYLATGDLVHALAKWSRVRDKSGAIWDAAGQRFVYPEIHETYHLGLFRILTDSLLAGAQLTPSQRAELLQHSVALRSHVLDLQEQGGDAGLGWRSDASDPQSLINIESTAVAALALGTAATASFEAGQSPLEADDHGYVLRPEHLLSAVHGASSPGYLTYGPYFRFPPGPLSVDFFLRAPSPAGVVATVEVRDAASGRFLAQRDVAAADFAPANAWTQITLVATVPDACNRLEFRTYWHGGSDLDVGYVRAR